MRQRYLPQIPPKTVSDVFDSGMPAISTLRREKGEAIARAVLVLILNDMLDFFNASNDMNDTQVAMTVDFILEEYPYMQTDDITLCFRNAMKGKYGKLYNRIDGQIIMGWIKAYNSERCAAAQATSENESKTRKQDEKSVSYTQYFDMIREKAANGDKEALKMMDNSFSINKLMKGDRTARLKKQLEEFDRKRGRVT